MHSIAIVIIEIFTRMAMAAVLLEEWLQELAAIAQEHALLEQQAAILR